jgi:tetratricopeptide (TPR) repeat protein
MSPVRRAFRKAADVRQEDFQSPLLLAQSLKMLGRHDEASAWRREGIRRAEHVLALNPLDGRAMSLGALYLLEEGQAQRAVEWSERALELYPDDMSALGNGACLQAKRTPTGIEPPGACPPRAGASATGWATPTTTACAATRGSSVF